MSYVDKIITDRKEMLNACFLTNTKVKELCEKASELKIVCSSFTDPGGDWNEYQFTMPDGSTRIERIAGY